MGNLLDIRTLLFVNGVISFVLFMTLSYIYTTRKTYPGFREWVIAFFIFFGSLILIGLRGLVPDNLSVVAGNLFVVAYIMLIHYGLVLFTGSKQKMGWYIFALTFMLITFVYFTHFSPNVNIRIIIISGIIALYCIHCVMIAYKRLPLILKDRNWLLILALSLMTFQYALRFFFTLFLEDRISDFMKAGTFHGVTLIVTMAANILIALGLIIVNLQKVEQGFLMARNEIKTLKGFLPICSSCKKIRDDKGYWTQIEAYIREHSEAEFSHGLCPDCMKRLYPDFAEKE